MKRKPKPPPIADLKKNDKLPVELIEDIVGYMVRYSITPFEPRKKYPVEATSVRRLIDGVGYCVLCENPAPGLAARKTKLDECAMCLMGVIMVQQERVVKFHKQFEEMSGRSPSFRKLVKMVANHTVTMSAIKFDTSEYKPMYMYSWVVPYTWNDVSATDVGSLQGKHFLVVANAEARIRHMLNGMNDLVAGDVRNPPCRLCLCRVVLNEHLNMKTPNCAKCEFSKDGRILE